MNMVQAVASVFRNYATFSGRARLAEYWWYTLAESIFVFALLFGTFALAAALYPDGGEGAGMIVIVGYGLLCIYALGTLVPRIAVTVRRIQDAGMRGSLFWLSFVPMVGGTIVLVLTLMPGTRGPNRYGPDPRDPYSSRGFSQAGSFSRGPIPQNAFAATRITPPDYVPPMQGPGGYAAPTPAYVSQPPAPPTYAPQPAQQPYVQQPAQQPYVQPTPPPYVQQPPPPPYVQQPPPPPYVQQPPPPPYVQQPPPPYVQQPPPPYPQQPPPQPYLQQPPPAPPRS